MISINTGRVVPLQQKSREEWREAVSEIPVFDTHSHLNKPGVPIGARNVEISPAGFARFDGQGGYLFAEVLATPEGTYTVSFWFRSDDYEEQQSNTGVLISTSENPFFGGNWQVSIRQEGVRFGGKTVETGGVAMSVLKEPQHGFWNLITLKFDEAGAGGFWINEEPFLPLKMLNSELEGTPPTYRAIQRLVVGTDTLRKNGFIGDVADIRIYDDIDWDDAKQAAAYQAGPAQTGTP